MSPYKDPVKRTDYQRTYSRLRRAGLTKRLTDEPLVIDDTLRLEYVKDYLDVINRVIVDVRHDVQSSCIQKARAVGYLVTIALKALELGAIEERTEQLEQALDESRG